MGGDLGRRPASLPQVALEGVSAANCVIYLVVGETRAECRLRRNVACPGDPRYTHRPLALEMSPQSSPSKKTPPLGVGWGGVRVPAGGKAWATKMLFEAGVTVTPATLPPCRSLPV